LSTTTSIHWNGLFLDIPPGWDVIVKDIRHLIIETDLKPLLEIRWLPGAPGKSARQFKKITAHLSRDGEAAPPGRNDHISKKLLHSFHLKRFDSGPSESVLLLTCLSCATTILVKLHRGSLKKLADHPLVLDSLRCHGDDQERERWRFQDFYFFVPDVFELKSSSFRLGLASLLFTSKSGELAIFRLAAADQHLKNSSLTELFSVLCSAPSAEQFDKDSSTLLHYQFTPGTTQKIWSTLRRKKPYRAASLSHFPHANRILGYSISSRRAIDDELKSAIQKGYGIIQEKESDTDPDQGSSTGLHPGQK